MKRGRPSVKTKVMCLEICKRLADGQALTTICKDKHIASVVSVQTWLRNDPEFLADYTHARECQADKYAEEIVAIADAASNETFQSDRLRIDARKWVAGKLKGTLYGDKVTNEHVGKAGGAIDIHAEITFKGVSPDDKSND